MPGFVRRLWEYILDKEDKNMMLDIGKVKNNKVNIPIEPKYLIYSFILVIVKSFMLIFPL